MTGILVISTLQPGSHIHDFLQPVAAACKKSYHEQLRAELSPLLDLKLANEKSKSATRPQLEAKIEAAGAIQTTWGSDYDEAFRPHPVKTKLKTRPDDDGAVTAVPEAADAPNPESSAEDDRVSICVTRANKTLFTRMFAAREEHRKDVRWDSFVAALVDAGYSATHNGGSAVTFKDERHTNGRSIVVHKPHPDPSVDPIMLRSIGRRLRRRFGWDAETFVERG